MLNIAIQIIGWVGAFLVIFAFYLNSNSKIKSDSLNYQLMNFFASVFVGINAFYLSAYPSLGIQIVWGMIALFSLFKLKKS